MRLFANPLLDRRYETYGRSMEYGVCTIHIVYTLRWYTHSFFILFVIFLRNCHDVDDDADVGIEIQSVCVCVDMRKQFESIVQC